MKTSNRSVCLFIRFLLIFTFVFGLSFSALAQTSVFTYQGRFTDSTVAQPTTGTYDFQFTLWDAVNGGT
jgi:hypothetical protein